MRHSGESGVTLIEMLAVVTIIGLIAAVSYPAVGAGLESIRLASATDAIVAFLNSALNRAERRQEPVEITVSLSDRSLAMRSTDPAFIRTLEMPEGVTILRVHPQPVDSREETSRSLYVYPGGTVPRIGVEVANRRGARRIVRVDPATGVAAVQRIETEENR